VDNMVVDPDESAPCDSFQPDTDDINECGSCGLTAQEHQEAGSYVPDIYQGWLD